jgi:hypothetical protein
MVFAPTSNIIRNQFQKGKLHMCFAKSKDKKICKLKNKGKKYTYKTVKNT